MGRGELFIIGQVVAPHGIHGEVRVLPLTDFPERFKETREVYLCKGEKIELRRVVRGRLHKNMAILKLEGCDTVEEAERLRGVELKVEEGGLVQLPPGHYYVHQLLGLPVYTLAGERLGVVREVLRTGANDVYVLSPGSETEADLKEPRPVLIPALKEVVKEIDLREGKILIDPIPGLIER